MTAGTLHQAVELLAEAEAVLQLGAARGGRREPESGRGAGEALARLYGTTDCALYNAALYACEQAGEWERALQVRDHGLLHSSSASLT